MNFNENEEKTENPTENHIKKFKKKGQTRYSKELNSFFVLSISFLSLWWFKNSILFNFKKIMSESLVFNRTDIIYKKNFFLDIAIFFKEICFSLAPFFILLILIIVMPSIFFSGISFSFRSLRFDLEKLNIFYGLKKILSFQVIIELFKMLFKLLIISIISLFYIWMSFPKLLALVREYPISAFVHGSNMIFVFCILITFGLIPIVIFDVLYQQLIYRKKIKMTRYEIKRELQEQEGNFTIKSRIRQLMQAVRRRKMVLDVPKSDVIITNPIFYAVALQYDPKKMNAPKVLAKGIGETAIKIQKIAIKNNISIISIPSLARVLYRYSEVGQYIPGSLYQAVAEVLAWVWKVRIWKKEGGVFPEKPRNISVPSNLYATGEYETNE